MTHPPFCLFFACMRIETILIGNKFFVSPLAICRACGFVYKVCFFPAANWNCTLVSRAWRRGEGMRFAKCSWLSSDELRRRRCLLPVPDEWAVWWWCLICGTMEERGEDVAAMRPLCKSRTTRSARWGGVAPLRFTLLVSYKNKTKQHNAMMQYNINHKNHTHTHQYGKLATPIITIPIGMSVPGWPRLASRSWKHSEFDMSILVRWWVSVGYCCCYSTTTNTCASWRDAWFSKMQPQCTHARAHKSDHFIMWSSADITTIHSQQAVSSVEASPVCWTVCNDTAEDARGLARYREAKALLASDQLGYLVGWRWWWSLVHWWWADLRWEWPGSGLLLLLLMLPASRRRVHFVGGLWERFDALNSSLHNVYATIHFVRIQSANTHKIKHKASHWLTSSLRLSLSERIDLNVSVN